MRLIYENICYMMQTKRFCWGEFYLDQHSIFILYDKSINFDSIFKEPNYLLTIQGLVGINLREKKKSVDQKKKEKRIISIYVVPYVYITRVKKFTRTMQLKTISYVHHLESHWNTQPVPFRHSLQSPHYPRLCIYSSMPGKIRNFIHLKLLPSHYLYPHLDKTTMKNK